MPSRAIVENVMNFYILCMDKIKEYYLLYRTPILLFLAFMIIVWGLLIYRIHKNTYLTVEFKDLRPFHHHVDIFYKGFKIGRAEKIRPDKKYEKTLMTIVLHPMDLKLPVNTTATLKREKRNRREYDYVELVYPDDPSIYYLKSGDVIAGHATIDVQSFLASQDPETLEDIKNNLSKAAVSANDTLNALSGLFLVLTEVVQENRANILDATQNLKATTMNIRETSQKLNYSIRQNQLESTFTNVDTSTVNTRETTKNLQILTQDIDKVTRNVDKMLPKIDCIVNETYSVLRNANEITCDVSKTLKKRFGGMRLFFGKAAPNCSKPSCPCAKLRDYCP